MDLQALCQEPQTVYILCVLVATHVSVGEYWRIGSILQEVEQNTKQICVLVTSTAPGCELIELEEAAVYDMQKLTHQ